MPSAPAPVAVITKGSVLLLMITVAVLVKLMPETPDAGAMFCDKVLTSSVLTAGTAKSVPLAIPADWLF